MRRLRRFFRGRLFVCALCILLAVSACTVLAIKLPRLLAPAALMERALSFIAAVLVLAVRDLPERKIAKLLLLGFLPWVGAALVFAFTEVPPPAASLPEKGEGGTLFSRISALCERFSGTHVGNGTLTYYASGEDMRPALLTDLKGAKRRIYLEYYIVAEGQFWGEIEALLEEKAEAGVDVRVIFDDFGCSLTLPRRFGKTLEAKGIRCAVFGRLAPVRGVTRRDHRKLFLIDDVCFVGGINLADEYVGQRIRFGHWKDSAVRVCGDVTSFYRLFLRTWCGLTRSHEEDLPQISSGEGAPYAVLSDGTAAGERLIMRALPLMIGAAQRSLFLSSPYLSLPHGVMELLGAAAAAGVDVRVMIPHIPDKRAVFFLTRAYARELQRMGVKVREYAPGFLHAKSLLIDGKAFLVSSYNLDFRSLCVQAECGLFSEDEGAAAALGRDFVACFEEGLEPKRANAFVRILGRIAMLFAPLT